MSAPERDLGLAGLRVLILEDSFLVAQDLAAAVSRCGCTVLGPAASSKKALEILKAGGCDGAILDVNLGATNASPVAEELARRGIRFFFLTGYSDDPPFWQGQPRVPLLRKPVDPIALCETMSSEFGKNGGKKVENAAGGAMPG